jgi:hypothetical protein
MSPPGILLGQCRHRRATELGESAVSENEADEMEEHLRGLGYIE